MTAPAGRQPPPAPTGATAGAARPPAPGRAAMRASMAGRAPRHYLSATRHPRAQAPGPA